MVLVLTSISPQNVVPNIFRNPKWVQLREEGNDNEHEISD